MSGKNFLSLALILLLTSITAAQKFEVSPKVGLADDSFRIKISGLPPLSVAIIHASLVDAKGQTWKSVASFKADARGDIDVSRQPPINGDYVDVDPDGLVLHMNPSAAKSDQTRFSSDADKPYDIRFDLEVKSTVVRTQTVTRRFSSPGVSAHEISEDGLVGKLYVPAGHGRHPAILVLGGSEGGLSDQETAAILASRGFAALALAYFRAPGLPDSLSGIRFEYFESALEYLKKHPSVRPDSVAILGTSKGAEAALLVASRDRSIRAVVAYVPSAYVWSCICDSSTESSWSFQGRPVTFIPQGTDPTYAPDPSTPRRPLVNYLYRLNQKENVARAIIPVDLINGPVMTISGENDQMWPSFLMAKTIESRRAGLRFHDRYLAYPGAGHLIGKAILPYGSTLVAGGRIETGGSTTGNAVAGRSSWPEVLRFLRESLEPKGVASRLER